MGAGDVSPAWRTLVWYGRRTVRDRYSPKSDRRPDREGLGRLGLPLQVAVPLGGGGAWDCRREAMSRTIGDEVARCGQGRGTARRVPATVAMVWSCVRARQRQMLRPTVPLG